MAFGSDCMPMSPLLGIRCATAAVNKAQRLTVEQAFAAYTIGAAFAGFEDDVKGTISEGKVADFVVLSNDPFASPHNIGLTEVIKTVVAGRVVFDKVKPLRVPSH